MSELTKVLQKQIQEIEAQKQNIVSQERYRQKFHIMPPVGWLNDPNGLCYFNNTYHVFFQYCPFDANGGLKVWGHYTSTDLLTWTYQGVCFFPDSPYDCHGVYSGCAFVQGDTMHIFYTGNIKHDGEYDYIENGRESYTMKSESKDGIHFTTKKCVLSLSDMPKEYTCHIRDPKVYQQEDTYFMVLGGRKKSDVGAVLVFASKDLETWKFHHEITSDEPFGYMWECPDILKFGDMTFLSMSPQGLQREKFRFQNVYQSGYVAIKNDTVHVNDFKEWDYGFDFYAPQTFTDDKGRVILIGWSGVPDSEQEYTNPTVKGGWQHHLTLLREVTYKEGTLLQYPVSELYHLRKEFQEIHTGEIKSFKNKCFDCEIMDIYGKININICEGVQFTWEQGEAQLTLSKEIGFGRTIRKAKIETIEHIRIVTDVSAIEFYINHGEYVFTTRFYPTTDTYTLQVNGASKQIHTWALA